MASVSGNERLAQTYLDVVRHLIITLDSSGRITFLNKKGCQILGYKKDELIGKSWFDTCLPKQHRKEVKKVFKKCIAIHIELFLLT